ncbi:MAG: baseplate J/gp47 family protein [Chitinispirillia bacterium]|nr:baseplate J/gp47 family protein [Chitinispirillia bacterium]
MTFQRDYNELLSEVLTEYRNLTPDGEITEGSVLFIKSSVMASVLWGINKTLDTIANQFFVETADRRHIEMHASEYGIATFEKSDVQLIEEILAVKRSKMSGGNRYDYAAWAREVTLDDESIVFAMIVPLARGEGTFDIVVVGSNNYGWASDEIRDKIIETVDLLRPIGSGFSWGIRVLAVTVEKPTVTISGTGINWDQIATKEAIITYINTLLPGQTLHSSQILSIMHQYGAETAEVTWPIGQYTPPMNPLTGYYGILRATSSTVQIL